MLLQERNRKDIAPGYGLREGDERLSGTDKAEKRSLKPDQQSAKPGRTVRKKRSTAPELGRALRSVYDETLREEVPDDFLDLLGKLS